MWRTLRLTRQSSIAAFLRRDRLYAAYALGDLEPEFFPRCDWFGADCDGVLQTLVLVYRGLTPPTLFAMGDADGLAVVLRDGVREARLTYMLQAHHLPALQAFYQAPDPRPMWRMAVRANAFRPRRSDLVRRLYPGDTRPLEALYEQAQLLPGEEVVAFTPAQVAQGVFYGVRVQGTLVAAAGVHLVARSRKLAVVGNVFTHPEHRGRGYATACTSAVTAELIASEIVDVVLNVAQANAPAIRVYEGLGYAIATPFSEGLAERRDTGPA